MPTTYDQLLAETSGNQLSLQLSDGTLFQTAVQSHAGGKREHVMAGTAETSDGVIAAHPVRQHVRKMLDKVIVNQQNQWSTEATERPVCVAVRARTRG